jgi:small-conductance mechanosensitive channel|tara:strand:- start:22 stop:300 length:279 start_codon:yes stop_codon:yes gene_type:complete
MEIFNLISELGFTITAVLAGGMFIIILLKYILASVVDTTATLNIMISGLDNRVKTINNDMVRLDSLVCHVLGVKPDVRRMSAADGKEDARKD